MIHVQDPYTKWKSVWSGFGNDRLSIASVSLKLISFSRRDTRGLYASEFYSKIIVHCCIRIDVRYQRHRRPEEVSMKPGKFRGERIGEDVDGGIWKFIRRGDKYFERNISVTGVENGSIVQWVFKWMIRKKTPDIYCLIAVPINSELSVLKKSSS